MTVRADVAKATAVVVTVGGFGLTTHGPPISPPANLQAADLTETSLALTWSPAADTGDFGITGYNVYESVAGSDTLLGNVATAPYAWAITGLTAGSTHTYRVTAVTSLGEGPAASIAVTTDDPPDTTPPTDPTSVTAAPTTNAATLNWHASTDADSGVDGYNIYLVVAGSDVFQAFVEETETSYRVGGSLSPGTAYTAKVQAKDVAGNLSNKVAVGFTTDTPADTIPPTVPGNFRSTAKSDTTITLAWDASTDSGSGVAGYEVIRNFAVVATVTSGTSTTLTGLRASTAYTYTVRAYDNAGNRSTGAGPLTVTTDAAADTIPPTVPADLASTAKTTSTITLGWTAATDVGGSGVAEYELSLTDPDGTTTTVSGITGTSKQVTGLEPGTAYSIAIRAKDVAGNWSALSGPISVTTNAAADTTRPTAPGAITVSNLGTTSVTLTWGASTDAGGSGLAGYEVIRNAAVIATVDAPAVTVNLTGLDAGTEYKDVAVRAYDGAGNRSTTNPKVTFTTKTASVAGKYNRQVGFVAGPVTSEAGLTAVVNLINASKNSATGKYRLALIRSDYSWNTVYNNDDTYATLPGFLDDRADNVVGANAKIHALAAYSPGTFVDPIDIGSGSLVKGETVLHLTTKLPRGYYGEISVHGPGLPTSPPFVQFLGDPPTDTFSTNTPKLELNGSPYTIPANASGSYTIGGKNNVGDSKMTARAGTTQTDTLAPIGVFAQGLCTALGTRADSVEFGNEIQGSLGNRPYVRTGLQFRNLCHAYVGAKLGNSAIDVVAPGTNDNLTLLDGKSGTTWTTLLNTVWYARLKAEADHVTLGSGDLGGPYVPETPAGYFAALKSKFSVTSTGSMPWDVLATHPYNSEPAQITTAPAVMANIAVIYNLFGGTYPIMLSEQGAKWVTSGGSSLASHSPPYTPAGAGTWYQELIDYCHGNRKWDHTPHFTGTDGATLSKAIVTTVTDSSTQATLADHQAAARRIFRPMTFMSVYPPSDVPDVAMYTKTTPAVAKWDSSSTSDPIYVMSHTV